MFGIKIAIQLDTQIFFSLSICFTDLQLAERTSAQRGEYKLKIRATKALFFQIAFNEVSLNRYCY